jgi:hypothetical protein
MKKNLILILLLLVSGIARTQNTTNESLRFIEVTGSSELEVEPDEIRLEIEIAEYWKEEFEKKTDAKDYRTKVPLEIIEKELLADLAKIGIPKENIITQDAGNYRRQQGKEFLFNKQIELVLFDFKKVDEIINTINTKGINYVSIGKLKNKNITELTKQVKIEALKAAKVKAGYLVESLGKQLGDVISVTEVDEDGSFWGPRSANSNTIMLSADDSGIDNIRKIKLRYEMKAKFEIK